MNILIADDQEVFRNATKYYLKKYNFKLTIVENGAEALAECEKTNFDILFLDNYMPRLNGMDVIKSLDKTQKNAKTDVVLISSSIDLCTLLELKKYGVKYFLSKPIDIRSFYHIVEEIIEIKNKQNEKFMQMALKEAWKFQFVTYPNPAVGATIVKNGKAISIEAHQEAGMPHAEVFALKSAYLSHYPNSELKNINDSHKIHEYLIKNHNNFFEDCDIYVTLEPCNHVGKTPACSHLLSSVKIKKVYIGSLDPNIEASGGYKYLLSSNINVATNICTNETDKLLFPFLKYQSGHFVFFKMAMRQDGSIDGGYITTQDSLNLVHDIRSKINLMVVGGNTVRSDRPTLDSRFSNKKVAPDILIYSKSKDFDKSIPLFNIPNRIIKISNSLKLLEKKEFVMIEGGYTFFERIKNEIDYLMLFVSYKKSCNKKILYDKKIFILEYSYFLNEFDEILFLKRIN